MTIFPHVTYPLSPLSEKGDLPSNCRSLKICTYPLPSEWQLSLAELLNTMKYGMV